MRAAAAVTVDTVLFDRNWASNIGGGLYASGNTDVKVRLARTSSFFAPSFTDIDLQLH